MHWQLSPSVLAEAGTALGILIVAIFFPWRDINRRARIIGSALLVIAALWIFTHSLEIGITAASTKASLMGMQLIWGLFAVTLWLNYIIHYTATEKWQTRRTYILFGVMPLLSILALVTNNIYGLMWTDPGLNINNPYLLLEPAYGLVYWVFLVYMGALIVSGSYLVIRKVLGQHNFRGWEPWTLILAVVIPLIVAFLEVMGFTKSENLTIGLTPFFSGIGSVVLVWSLPRFHLQNVIPVARDTVFEQIGDCVVVLNMQNRIVDLNPAAEQLAGYTNSQALGLPVEQIWTNWPSRLEPASTVFEELTLVHAGEQRTYSIHSHAITDHKNRSLNKVVLLIDITDRKRGEEELVFRAQILDGATDAIFVLDFEGNIIYVNEAACAMHALSKESLSKLNMQQLLATDGANSVESDFKMILEKGQAIFESAHITKNGDKVPVEVHGRVIESSGRKLILTVVHNIAERKKAEETLRISEEYNSSLVEKSPYPIQILNLDTSLRHVNPAFERLTGYTQSEISGIKPPFPWWIEEYIDRNQKLLNQGMQSGLEHAELSCRKKNGELFWVEVKSVVKQEQQNEPGYYLSMWTDVTERKKTEEELSKLNKELRTFNLQLEAKVEDRTKQLEIAVVDAEAANRAKSNFLASMSHELRTPLNAVIGFAQVLQQQYYGQLNEKQVKYMSNILESGKHLLSLINDILDLSKIEAGKEELVLSNIKIKELLEGSLVMVKEKAAAHGIKLELQIPSYINSLEIEADERKVKQIMFNLLSNAVKFTPDGGYVTIKCIKGEKELTISVSDSGIGLDPEQQKKLFERFYQVSGGITNKTPGTGLGLSLAKSMAEMHGGRMWVESDGLGKGSCFAFTLPLKRVSTKANT